jgi:hypothetical protein
MPGVRTSSTGASAIHEQDYRLYRILSTITSHESHEHTMRYAVLQKWYAEIDPLLVPWEARRG